jgi:hypothetical protein
LASKNKRPDFFIIGAQKSGTTTAAEYLNQHPQLFRSTKKEVHLFDRIKFSDSDISEYEQFFPDLSYAAHQTLYFEATPSYLPQADVPGRILKNLPESKFIVILRDPISRAFSAFHMMKRNERIAPDFSFNEFIKQDIQRLNRFFESRRSVLDRPRIYRGLIGRGLYAKQIEHWFSHFSPDQFLFLDFNELTSTPHKFYKRIYTFLNVQLNDLTHFIHEEKGGYKVQMDTESHQLLSDYYSAPNKALFDLLGRSFDW